ncbi:hypothetical protein PR003_g29430 [Phytophthora rubi]|uniref:Uncharacterized protein n=1 Tax=Phytophthora rubi TaxID=129364 RepID=A0A6A3HD96_9STRA|nr:hypothetical protein PR002_g28325 [Phytophthora rubi]KAE8967031.1 hypothetical protein PR001_g28221 [Phytophthora rubi]KAE9275087.1 hypothetical protein PR003_g29430 [Phytophthora rubi]
MKRKEGPPSSLTETGAERKLARGKVNHKDKPAMAEVARGTTRAGKKAPIFWDSDGVDGGKSSLRVVLDWMTNPANYDKWRGSDRHNGNTKEALLKQIGGRRY